MESLPSRILIADDETAHAEAMRRALLAGNALAEIAIAPTLAAFRAAAAENPPDLALVDLHLPDGRAVDALTEPPEAGAYPILVITSHGSEESAVDALKAGALDYVVKSPASFAELPRTVARAWREWRARCDRLQAETELRSREELLRLLFENASEAIVLSWEDGRVEAANPAACAVFGRSAAEMRRLSRSDLVDPADRRFSVALSTRETAGVFAGELNLVRSDGTVFPAAVSSTLYVDSSGQRRTSTFFRDLTEQKQLEAERAQLEVDLRQAQKLESLSTLSGGVAHDFNNILAVILGNAELALTHLVAEDHAVSAHLGAILKACDRATHLVRQVLAFARAEAPRRAAAPLCVAVEEAMRALRASLPPSVELILRSEADAPAVDVDAAQVHQAVVNLGTNAWHAIGNRPGQIILSLRALHPGERPPPPAVDGGSWTVLSVEDTGAGIDARTQERIFEPFFTTKGVGRGTGLGLAVVHGVMRAHGGVIAVRSLLGQGTTFDLFFPASTAPVISLPSPVEEAPLRATSEQDGEGRHILCVDDESPIAFLMQEALETYGYRVTVCTRAYEALAILRARGSEFDLLLTDYNMPGVSGLGVAREAARVAPGLPVVVASGFIDEKARLEAEALGVRQLLRKPVTMSELCGAIAGVLAGR